MRLKNILNFANAKVSKLTFGFGLLAITTIAVNLVAINKVSASSEEGIHNKVVDWSFNNIKNKWDKTSILRGYEVATQVCMSCHSFKYISHRNLMKVGFSEAEVKALASDLDLKITDKLMSGMSDADAREIYAKPLPDLSLMTKARPDGNNYLYSLLTGYSENPPHGVDIPDSAYYNKYFVGHAIAMPPPLMEDGIEYHDGTPATVEQMAKDVTYFMAWTAEPEKKDRENTGVYVLLFLLIFGIFSYLLKREIWKDIK